jgi:hypothetical protein
MSGPWKVDDYLVSSWNYDDVYACPRVIRSGAVAAEAA